MTTTLTWTDANGLNTILTDPANGISVLLGAAGLDAPPILNSLAGYTSQDGSSLVKRRRDVRPVILPMYVRNSTRVASTVAYLANVLQGPGVLTIADGTNTRTLLSVIYEAGLEGEQSSQMGTDGLLWRKFVVSMLALNPWWHDPEDTAVLNTDADEIPFDDPDTDFDDPGVAFDGSSTTALTVDGDTTALPVWTITGPYTTLSVGVEGGQSFTLAASLADGDVITVDTRPGVRGPRLNGGQIDWSLLTPASRLWELPVGSPTIVAGASGTDGGSSVEVAFRQRWLTP